MILGAGVYQVPLIKKAREMGLETIVLSYKGKFPGISLADIFLEIDTTDVDRITEAAQKFQISAIATTGTDVCVAAMGKVIDLMDLPGTGYESACRSMDKYLMKESFINNAVPTANFDVFYDLVKAKKYASYLGYPVMVKATDSSGGRGITKVTKADDFEFAWSRANTVSRSKRIIVEKFLQGVEFGAQAFIHKDKVVAIFFHGDTVTPAPYFTPIGHYMPADLKEEEKAKSIKVISNAARSLGLYDCISNVDLLIIDGEPFIIEMSARMGATCIPECISIYAGIDVYKHLIKLSMGEYPEITISKEQANECLLLRSDKTGRVSFVKVPDCVSKHPDLFELQLDISVGDQVRKFEVGPDRIGHIIVKDVIKQNIGRLAKELASKIDIKVK